MNMSYKSIILFLIVLMPLFASAQRTGGHVIRPTKKQEQKPVKRVNQTRMQTISKAERERILNNLIANMVYVEGGTFTMGATSEQGSDADEDEKPAHQVTVSSFSIGKYEVTQEEWQAVMGSKRSSINGAKLPVFVSWDDCKKFIRKLNSMTGKRFRLPTEAEWEYAARGGNRSHGYKYAGSNMIDSVAWYCKNSGGKTHDVGQLMPNELDLYDMSGNVEEWCYDWYSDYSSGSLINPPFCDYYTRVLRGGHLYDSAKFCRVSCRDNRPSDDNYFSGLRLAL